MSPIMVAMVSRRLFLFPSMYGQNPIYERLIQSGVFLWDASQRREFEVSDNFRDFLGLSVNKFNVEVLLRFCNPDMIDSIFRTAIDGEVEWRHTYNVGGREYRLRFIKLSQYFDSDGVRHSMGSASIDEAASNPQESSLSSGDEPMSIFEGRSGELLKTQTNLSRSSVYDLIADMLKTFRSHLPPGIMVSVWKCVGDEYLCVAIVGQIMTAQRLDVFRVGFQGKSPVMDVVMRNSGVQIFESLDDFKSVSERDVKAFIDSGWNGCALSVIRSIDSDTNWGFVSCISSRPREWSGEERQRLQLLSDSLTVLLAQSSAYAQVLNQLVLTRMACDAGGFYTWQWDVKSHKRSILGADGSLVDAPYDIYVHRSDRERFNQDYADVEAGRKSGFSIRMRARPLSSSGMRWFDVSIRAVTLDHEGRPEIIVGLARDVDKEVNAELERQKERQRTEDIYNKIPAIIAFCDTEGRQLYINDRCVDILGLRCKEDVKQANVFDCPIFTEEQKMLVRTRDNCNFNMLYDFAAISESGFFRTHRRDKVEINLRSSKLYSHGRVTGYLFVMTDSSMLLVQSRRMKLINDFFAEIGRFSKLGVCQFGAGGIASSQWYVNLAQDDSAGIPDKVLVCESMDPADLAIINTNLAKIYDGAMTSFKQDARVRHPDGSKRIVSFHFMYSDEVEAVTAISADVTEGREREAALVRALRKSEQVESLRTRFFNNVSHELRTPLNAIVGFSELIAQYHTDDDLARYAGIIRTNNTQLLNLVDGIMELSQIQSRSRRYVRSRVEVDQVITNLHDRMDGLQHEGVQFIVSHDPGMKGLSVSLDAVATGQILSKLVSNAFSFTESGCVMIWAQVDGANIIFHVSDTGCGIPDDKLASIFDIFVKLNPFGTGAGLGLPVCRGLARQMGGNIGVESVVGKGSHFWLSLPLLAADSPSSVEGLREAPAQTNVVVLPHGQDLTLAVSLLLPGCNVFGSDREAFSRIWMDNRPHLSIIDVRECPDVVGHFVSNIKAFGDKFLTLVVNTPDSGIPDSELLDSGAAAVVVAPLTASSLSHALAQIMPAGVVKGDVDGSMLIA